MRGLPLGALSQLLGRPRPSIAQPPRGVIPINQMSGAGSPISLGQMPQMPNIPNTPKVDPATHYERIIEKLKMKNKSQHHMNTAMEHLIQARAAMFPKAKGGK